MVDTDPGDRHILAAASAAGIRRIITADVDDFGRGDLDRLGLVAVNPDLFLSCWMSPDMYRITLERLAVRRSSEPYTAPAIHSSLGKIHPRLASSMRQVFPDIEIMPATSQPPGELFRGTRCLVCLEALADTASVGLGVCPRCRQRQVDSQCSAACPPGEAVT